MKDAPSVGNPAYSIGTNIPANMGKAFIQDLTPEQVQLITGLVDIQHPSLTGIVDGRTQISTQLRMFKTGGSADQETMLNLMEQYGELDGAIVYNFATSFTRVGQKLTVAQKAQLMDLRHLTLGDFTPKAAFLYAGPVAFPAVPSTDFLFK